jgi:hypothetical protein
MRPHRIFVVGLATKSAVLPISKSAMPIPIKSRFSLTGMTCDVILQRMEIVQDTNDEDHSLSL